MLWSTLATRDVRLAEAALSRRRPAPAPTSWVTYVRCRDDIGCQLSISSGRIELPPRSFLWLAGT